MDKLNNIISEAEPLKAPRGVPRPPLAPRDWEKAVGSRIAERTYPTRLDRGVLHVRAATSSWANELSLLADTILERLRASGLRVDSLRFSVGTVNVPNVGQSPRLVRRAATGAEPLPRELAEQISKVQNRELRAALAGAAASTLALNEERKGEDSSEP